MDKLSCIFYEYGVIFDGGSEKIIQKYANDVIDVHNKIKNNSFNYELFENSDLDWLVGVLIRRVFDDNKNGLIYIKSSSDKNNVFALVSLGNYLMETKQYDKAFECYTKPMELINTTALCCVGSYYENIYKNNEKAMEYYTSAIMQGSKEVLLYLGIYYHNKNNLKKALKYFTMALNCGNKYIEIDSHKYMAQCFYSQQNYSEAVKYFIMSIEKCNNDAIKHFDIIKKTEPLMIFLELLKITPKTETINNELKSISVYNSDIKEFMCNYNIDIIDECPICFDCCVLLQSKCKHCICITCYRSIESNVCPMCRHVPMLTFNNVK